MASGSEPTPERWQIGNARRRMRAWAADVTDNEAAATPMPITHGAGRRVQTIWLTIKVKPHMLVSHWESAEHHSPIPPRPTPVADAHPTLARVRLIIAEIMTGIPYGPCYGVLTEIEWEHWKVREGARYKKADAWLPTTNHSDLEALMRETQERLEALIRLGMTFAVPTGQKGGDSPRFKKSEAKKPPIEWLVVRRLAVRWIVDPGSYVMRSMG